MCHFVNWGCITVWFWVSLARCASHLSYALWLMCGSNRNNSLNILPKFFQILSSGVFLFSLSAHLLPSAQHCEQRSDVMVQTRGWQTGDQYPTTANGIPLLGVTAEGDTATSTAVSGSALKTTAPGLHSGLNSKNTLRDVSTECGN